MASADDLEFAKLAEQTERYDDMVKYMTNYVKAKKALTIEERNLLSVAYKNKIGARRAAHRITSNERAKLNDIKSEEEKTMKEAVVTSTLNKIEGETNDIYENIIDLIDNYLVPSLGDKTPDEPQEKTEERVFYYKMKGDYCRYKAEFSVGEEKTKASDKSLEAYTKAQEFAKQLISTHPVRLGLCLNFSVFHYEIRNDGEEACKIAKTAFDEAIADLDKVQEDKYKDSTLIMQLLRDNLTLWTSDDAGKEEDETAH